MTQLDTLDAARTRVLGNLNRAARDLADGRDRAMEDEDYPRAAQRADALAQVEEMLTAVKALPPNWRMLTIAAYVAEVGLLGGWISAGGAAINEACQQHYETFARGWLVTREGSEGLRWLGRGERSDEIDEI